MAGEDDLHFLIKKYYERIDSYSEISLIWVLSISY
jgi:hypothetical protein